MTMTDAPNKPADHVDTDEDDAVDVDAPPEPRGPGPLHLTAEARDSEVQRRLDSGDTAFAAALDTAMREAHRAGLHEIPMRFCPVCGDAMRRLQELAAAMLSEASRVAPSFKVVLIAVDEQGRCTCHASENIAGDRDAVVRALSECAIAASRR
jgi:hypothetical protein